MGRVYSSNWAMYTLQAGGGENTGRGWGEHRQGVGRTQAGGGENTLNTGSLRHITQPFCRLRPLKWSATNPTVCGVTVELAPSVDN